jgi:NADPH:quinone reductase
VHGQFGENFTIEGLPDDGNLQIEKGQTLLLRGATSALGQAASNIAASAGLNVIATTRNQARFEKLLGLGAESGA